MREKIDGFGENVAVDSTNMRAWANGQKYKYRGGPERESFSDPDASWGHRSAVSTRKGGGFYGYKLHMASCAETDLPLAWEVRPANDHDSRQLPAVLDRLPWKPQTAALDKGYDYDFAYNECAQRGILPIIAKRTNSGTDGLSVPRDSIWKKLYGARVSVEREFARLKELGLDAFRVRTLERVKVHADLCVLSRLLLALV